MTLLGVAVAIGLASFRLWRLLAADLITEPLRLRLPGPVVHWLECPWCSGSWWALGVTFAVDQFAPMPVPWLVAGAAAAVVGLTASRLDV